MLPHLGELAALATAACWVVSALSFESAGKRIGSLTLNLIRLTIALVPLSLWGLATRGLALPSDAGLHEWGWLAASAALGLVVGDLCLFRAFVLIGPRLGLLIMASAPMWAALFGFAFLGETLGLSQLAGMGAIMAGIAWAIASRGGASVDPTPGEGRWQGILLALVGALGQAGGLVVSKFGMGDYDAFGATQIRVIAGLVGFGLVVTATGWWPRVRAALHDGPAMRATVLGAIFGPFLGIGLSLYAIQHAPTGVAASLMATTPILMLPIAWFVRHERFAIGAWVGAVVAVGGVALLVW